MYYPQPVGTDFASLLIGGGILGLVVFVLVGSLMFIISAFIMSIWIRLILVFMRGALDREYGRMRAAGSSFLDGAANAPLPPRRPSSPLGNDRGPRD